MQRGLSLLSLLALGAPLVEAHKPGVTEFTYHRDVYPIFLAKCGACHQEGGVAPMSLLSYREAYPWAVAIKNEILALSMPPWFADERYGRFRHASPLTAGELNRIVDWCLGGAPEGEPPEAGREVEAAAAPGDPDLLLTLPAPHRIGAEVMESVHEVRLPTGLERERFLNALELRPQSPGLLRSALLFVVPEGSEATPSHLAGSWIAGEGALAWPAGRSLRLPPRSSILLRLHYRKTWLDEGKEISDRSAVALYLERDSNSVPATTLVLTAMGGENGFEEAVSQETRERVEVLALLPLVESPVEWLLAEALLPDGSSVPLIRLRGPNPEWPRTFWLEEPLSLPARSRLRLTIGTAGAPASATPHRLVVSLVAQRSSSATTTRQSSPPRVTSESLGGISLTP